MGTVGLVLGGGGITGAAYEMAALMALRLATGWDPDDADVIVGTSAGSFVAALVRSNALGLDTLVANGDTRQDVAERIGGRLFRRRPGVKMGTWVRDGLIPGLRRPGLQLLLGSPAPYEASGLAEWVWEAAPESAGGWPDKPTLITAYDIRARRRVAFGALEAPDVGLAEAVAASSAIPVVFRPYPINGEVYVDGGVVSGTHADLVLGHPVPLDLVLVLAPMAADERRAGAALYEKVLDRVGRSALSDEIDRIVAAWPDAEVLVLRPSTQVQAAMRPNPMDTSAAVPSFIRTLIAMRRTLARDEVWPVLRDHLGVSQAN